MGKICVVGFLVLSVRRRYAPVGVSVHGSLVGGGGAGGGGGGDGGGQGCRRRGCRGRRRTPGWRREARASVSQCGRSATGRRAHSSPAVEAM